MLCLFMADECDKEEEKTARIDRWLGQCLNDRADGILPCDNRSLTDEGPHCSVSMT